MGVIKNGVKGNSFKTPQLGIRAQVQHLQAYGSTGRLKQTVVDPRYTYVTRGCAEYVEYLGIQENPQHYGWAAGKDYGKKIITILNRYSDYEFRNIHIRKGEHSESKHQEDDQQKELLYRSEQTCLCCDSRNRQIGAKERMPEHMLLP